MSHTALRIARVVRALGRALGVVRALGVARALGVVRALGRALGVVTALAAPVALASCAADIEEGNGSIALAATDPALLDHAASFVFTFSTSHTCKELVDLGPAEIGDALKNESPPLQVVPKNQTDHVFGKVPPNQPIAYLVMASSKANANQRVELSQFAGTVFAMGCRDFLAPSGSRHDLPLTLFPVGLR